MAALHRYSTLPDDIESRVAALSPRERDCLRKVAAPMRTQQIAHELGLKPGTVDTYISSAFRKLGVGDRDTAARWLVAYEETLSGKTRSDFSGLDDTPNPDVSVAASRLPWPWPRSRSAPNDLKPLQRLMAILIATAILLGVATAYIAALVALGASV